MRWGDQTNRADPYRLALSDFAVVESTLNDQLIAEQIGTTMDIAADKECELRAGAALDSALRAGPFHPTPEEIEREVSTVLKQELSPQLQQWVDRYAQIGNRHPYLWKWCCRGVEVTTLSCVSSELRENACDTKVLGVMLDVLMDDVADQRGDGDFLEHLLNLPYRREMPDCSRFSPKQQAYARFTADVWDEIGRRVQQYPCFEAYADQLRFDYLQLFNVMRYSRLLNENPVLLNLVEHDLYLPHNMHMMISATIDLMCSPDFDRSEWGMLREAVWYAQCMGRIGNLTTTWQRELDEGDFTSGVFAHAVSHGDLTVHDLTCSHPNLIAVAIQRGGHEEHFLNRWQHYRRKLIDMCVKVHSVDLGRLVSGLERLICLHLGSRGKK